MIYPNNKKTHSYLLLFIHVPLVMVKSPYIPRTPHEYRCDVKPPETQDLLASKMGFRNPIWAINKKPKNCFNICLQNFGDPAFNTSKRTLLYIADCFWKKSVQMQPLWATGTTSATICKYRSMLARTSLPCALWLAISSTPSQIFRPPVRILQGRLQNIVIPNFK